MVIILGVYCKKCNTPIEGQSIKALNSMWHPNHFVCSKCSVLLTSGTFVEKNAKPFCASCSLTII